ncbi:unnamed protein product, partial [Brenthis ino]
MGTSEGILIVLSIVLSVNGIKFFKSVRPSEVFQAFPCSDQDIVSKFKTGLESGYNITINKPLTIATDVRLIFDSQAAILVDNVARFSTAQDNIYNIFNLIIIQNVDSFTFTVKGQASPYSPPYLTSLKINGVENCREHNLTYFEDFPVGVIKRSGVPDRYCGKRKVLHTELIVNGYSTKPGDWPWHTAIYRQEKAGLKYVCGGTLVTKHFVLTAAHCTTINGIPVLPDILGVFLGKYNLYGSDEAIQEREVFQVIVHDEYYSKNLKNDISLLKLRTDVLFNNYVQPVCLWYDDAYYRLPTLDIFGTVVGWGFDSSDSLSSTLHATTMPKISELTCVLSNPVFYGNFIQDGTKFCAGYRNGTSACNGDSGGGFFVFVPDLAKRENVPNDGDVPGAWYLKGIVSASLSRSDAPVCDPFSYVVFSDISKYLDWIKDNIK